MHDTQKLRRGGVIRQVAVRTAGGDPERVAEDRAHGPCGRVRGSSSTSTNRRDGTRPGAVRGLSSSRTVPNEFRTVCIEPVAGHTTAGRASEGRVPSTLNAAQVIIESWRRHYSTIRSRGALGDEPPAPGLFVAALTARPAPRPQPASPPKRPVEQRSTLRKIWNTVYRRPMRCHRCPRLRTSRRRPRCEARSKRLGRMLTQPGTLRGPPPGSPPGMPRGSPPGMPPETPPGMPPGPPRGPLPGAPPEMPPEPPPGTPPGKPPEPPPGTLPGTRPGMAPGRLPGTPPGPQPGPPLGTTPGTPLATPPGPLLGLLPGMPPGSRPGPPSGTTPGLPPGRNWSRLGWNFSDPRSPSSSGWSPSPLAPDPCRSKNRTRMAPKSPIRSAFGILGVSGVGYRLVAWAKARRTPR